MIFTGTTNMMSGPAVLDDHDFVRCGGFITDYDFLDPNMSKLTRNCEGHRARYVTIQGFHSEWYSQPILLCEFKVFATDEC